MSKKIFNLKNKNEYNRKKKSQKKNIKKKLQQKKNMTEKTHRKKNMRNVHIFIYEQNSDE